VRAAVAAEDQALAARALLFEELETEFENLAVFKTNAVERARLENRHRSTAALTAAAAAEARVLSARLREAVQGVSALGTGGVGHGEEPCLHDAHKSFRSMIAHHRR
jgi:hypothetical protein